jgi:hypothetical protein
VATLILFAKFSQTYAPEVFTAPLLHLSHEEFWSLDISFFISLFVPENMKDKDYDFSVLHLYASSFIGPP